MDKGCPKYSKGLFILKLCHKASVNATPLPNAINIEVTFPKRGT